MKLKLVFKSQDDPNGGPQQQVFVEVQDEAGNTIPFTDAEWSADGEYEQLTIDTDNLPRHEMITIDGKEYRKFIRYPEEITDDTLRCISCGQIDEEKYHDEKLCPATNPQNNR